MRGGPVLVVCVGLGLAVAGSARAGWAATSAMEDPVAAPYIRSLTQEGYTDISVGTTWLGRVRILAWLDGKWREIVLHPTSGEVLRDVVYAPDFRMAGDGASDHDGPVPTETGTAAARPVATGMPTLGAAAVGAAGSGAPDAADGVPLADDGSVAPDAP